MPSYRYWRINVLANGGSGSGIDTVQMRTTSGGTNLSLTGGGTASASTTDTAFGMSAATAFDGNDSTYWAATSAALPQWLQWDFGTPTDINEVTLVNGSSLNPLYRLTGGTIQYSSDASTWTTFAPFTHSSSALASTTVVYVPPATGDAAITAPVFQVAGYGGATLALTAAAFSVASFGGATARVLAPMGAVKSQGGGRASMLLPMFEVRSTGGEGRNGSNVTLPMMAVKAYSGAFASVVVPMAQVSSTLTIPVWGNAAVAIPMPVVAASGTTSARGSGDIFIPMASIRSQGGHNAGVAIPMPTVAASMAAGGYGRGSITMPMMTVLAGATSQGMGAAALMLPMFVVRGGKGSGAAITIPMAQVVAIGGASVTVSYEAYSVNLTHVLGSGRQAAVDEVTRYTNFPFTDIVRLGNDYFGVGADGLYKLGGATDYDPAEPLVPKPIGWAWRSAITDFGSPSRKTPVSAYFAGRFAPDAEVTIYAGETGSVSYAYSTPRGAGAQNYRQKFGRGLDARYYALGVNGEATMSLDMIEFDITTLTRRI